MSKLDAYRVDLLSSKLQGSRLEWNLDDSFFEAIRKKGMIGHEGGDRQNIRNMSNLSRKRRMVALLFKSLYLIMGYKRYSLFLRSLYFYCRPELHTFLIKK